MMDRLPHELLKMVVDFVDEYDDFECRQALKNLRLLSRTLSKLAAVPLFRTISLWLGIDSLTHLTRIAEHDQL